MEKSIYLWGLVQLNTEISEIMKSSYRHKYICKQVWRWKNTQSSQLTTSLLYTISDTVNRGKVLRLDVSGTTIQATSACKYYNNGWDWPLKTTPLTEGKKGRRRVMDDELPHPGGLPVCSELLQVLMDGVNGLIHLVHAVLEMTAALFRETRRYTVQIEAVWGHARANELTTTQQNRIRRWYKQFSASKTNRQTTNNSSIYTGYMPVWLVNLQCYDGLDK